MAAPSSSFSISRVNQTTFLIIENDKYDERPFIYAKLHPRAPILILNDTGCDAPKHAADITRLLLFLETYPVPDNEHKPLNRGAQRQYLIILSHCHYDHIGGIEQFYKEGKAAIVASAAGRDFFESDLPAHSICKHVGIPTPRFKVSHWAQSNERLTWPLSKGLPGDDVRMADTVDLGMLMLQTPGHTPCSLSWYDEDENTVFIGDSAYRLGKERQPIFFPPQGDLVEWLLSMKKVAAFADAQSAASIENGEWVEVRSEMKLCASHETCGVPAKEFFQQLHIFEEKMINPDRKPTMSLERWGETFDYYLSDIAKEGLDNGMAILLPRRLVDASNRWFGIV